ncbi:hypothetical protein [Streptomyces sp. NPDC001404]|uniref:hypothetical protein n=1 Tax=Streptomyces sp. NPDC001404 TaxID=3364571 RepID=UPI00367B49D8
MAINGNFLSANVESVETDASGWLAGSNTSIAQSTAHALDGTHSLALTSTASGSTVAFVANRVGGVTASGLYACYFWMYSTIASITAWASVDWYNASNTWITNTAGPTVTLATNTWTQVGAPLVAVATATQSVPIINVTATAGSQVFYADEMFFGPAQLPMACPVWQAPRRASVR